MAKNILISLEEEVLEEINDYQFEKRIPNRAQAIRELLAIALKQHKNEKDTQ